jgi:hypothetical protein
LIVGTSQFESSQQSLAIQIIILEQVQAKAQLRAEMVELKDKLNVIEQLLATLIGIFAPLRCPFNSGEDSPPSSLSTYIT